MDSMDFLTFPRQCRVVAVAHGARASHARQPGDPRQPGGSCQSAAREVEGRQGLGRWDGYGWVTLW